MPITRSSDFPKSDARYPDQWGPWKFQVSGLKNVNADYSIQWARINHGTDVLAWVIQLSNKNRSLYGATVVQDLVDAFKDVLGLCMMNDAEKPVNGAQKAKEYRRKLKEQALSAK